jgi:hypothetical protein
MRAVIAPCFVVMLFVAAKLHAGETPEPAPALPDSLPDALPPLDDGLVDEPAPPARDDVRFMAAARIRGELDENRGFSQADPVSAGAAISARAGVEANLESARVVVVLGDGGRLGQPPTSPLLVERPALPVLQQARLSIDLAVAGLPAELAVGRMPIVVGDGRLLGSEPFDPRGRTLDGALLRAHGGAVDGRAGVVWLGPSVAGEDDTRSSSTGADLSGVGFVELAVRDEALGPVFLDVDAHGLLHRDGRVGVTAPTAGVGLAARSVVLPALDGAVGGEVSARSSVELQAQFLDERSATAPAGQGARAGIGVRGKALLSSWGRAISAVGVPDPFVDLSGEICAGDVVKGRVLRAPAPTVHGFLGVLDLVGSDNTWSAALAAGATDDEGLALDVTGRIVGIVDRDGPLLDVTGAPVPQRTGNGTALVELDAHLGLPVGRGFVVGVDYGVALPGAALIGDEPAQRFLVTLAATTESDAGARGDDGRGRNGGDDGLAFPFPP